MSLTSSPVPTMSEEEHKLLSEFIRQSLGLDFPLRKKGVLELKLHRRLKSLHLHNFMEYYRYLGFSARKEEELENLCEALTNNETYFFRETEDIELFLDHFIPKLKRKRPDQTIRLLSLGCSTGEEPYTLAMQAIMSGQLPPPWKLEIHAIDINRKVLEEARHAHYEGNSMRAIRPEHLDKFFNRNGNSSWVLQNHIRHYVTFQQGNLLDLGPSQFPGKFDAIFCRNVVIYFDTITFLKAAKVIYNLLAPDGYLFLGHSESLISLTDQFQPLRIGERVLYVRS